MQAELYISEEAIGIYVCWWTELLAIDFQVVEPKFAQELWKLGLSAKNKWLLELDGEKYFPLIYNSHSGTQGAGEFFNYIMIVI